MHTEKSINIILLTVSFFIVHRCISCIVYVCGYKFGNLSWIKPLFSCYEEDIYYANNTTQKHEKTTRRGGIIPSSIISSIIVKNQNVESTSKYKLNMN